MKSFVGDGHRHVSASVSTLTTRPTTTTTTTMSPTASFATWLRHCVHTYAGVCFAHGMTFSLIDFATDCVCYAAVCRTVFVEAMHADDTSLRLRPTVACCRRRRHCRRAVPVCACVA